MPTDETLPPGPDDLTDVVRRGYDVLSERYRADDATAGQYAPWIEALASTLTPGAAVLDLGCGNGVPVARELVRRGFAVTGVDLSDVQVARARTLVPGARFLRADAAAETELDFPPGTFAAAVCLYMLIHVPLARQPGLLQRIASWLRPGGVLLATTGHTAWTGSEDGWLGGTAPMWWSHTDAATYRQWLTDAGFAVRRQEFVAEGDGGHALFWCRRDEPAGPTG